jgi:hypothetical protein
LSEEREVLEEVEGGKGSVHCDDDGGCEFRLVESVDAFGETEVGDGVDCVATEGEEEVGGFSGCVVVNQDRGQVVHLRLLAFV